MIDFEIQRCSRRCSVSGRELMPGETYFSALISEGAEVVRRDFAVEAWTNPPEKSIGWWKSQVPEANAKKVPLAPSEVMLQYFNELEGRPEKEQERYVLALLMIRRRILREERMEIDPFGRETLVLYCSKNEQEYRAVTAPPSVDRIEAIQEELGRLLFSPGT